MTDIIVGCSQMIQANLSDQLYGEDLHLGFSFCGHERLLTRQDFEGFAALTGDDHPIHYDEAYAARTRFRRPVAHGLLLVGLSAVGATDLSKRLEASMIALVEQGAKFRHPVFAGDRITPRFTVTALEPNADQDKGFVRVEVQQINAEQKVCVEGFHIYMLRWRRPAEERSA